MRDVQRFLPLEYLQATVGLLSNLISIVLCLREWGRGSKEMKRENTTAGQGSNQNTHNMDGLSLPSYMGNVCGTPKLL